LPKSIQNGILNRKFGTQTELNIMKKRNLKKIVKDLKLLLEELESEVYSDPSLYVHPWYEETEGPRVGASEDDDGYPE
tara:strand:- start:764 stop:997 length:234 start_codon:yes stop_codon:yes gene_type:complete